MSDNRILAALLELQIEALARLNGRVEHMAGELDALKQDVSDSVAATTAANATMAAASTKIDALAAQVSAGGVASAADLTALSDELKPATAAAVTQTAELQPKTV